MVIQWFPGHMAKATRDMEARIKMVDVVIEMRDARIPFSSANPALERLAERKHRLIVLNKADLAKKSEEKSVQAALRLKYEARAKKTNKRVEILHISAATLRGSHHAAQQLLGKARALMYPRPDQSPERHIPLIAFMICGIPNVGKSILLNAFKAKHVAATGRSPGITRMVGNAIPLGGTPPAFIVDTPGVMLPKIDDETVGFKLAVIGSISVKQLDAEIIGGWLLDHLPRVDVIPVLFPPSSSQILTDLALRLGVNQYQASEFIIRSFQRGLFGPVLLDSIPSDLRIL